MGGQSESEKLNIWVALLNLENAYGNGPEAIETTFKAACRVNDPQEIHERLASIYIQSSKHAQADQLLQTTLKKFGSTCPKLWLNYAVFLFDTVKSPDRARALLSRALQTLPTASHVDITAKFAALEFRSSTGLAERGRTIFEGLLASFPKRVDLWNVLLDLEIKHAPRDDPAAVRRLFERIFSSSSASSSTAVAAAAAAVGGDGGAAAGGARLKNKQAKFFFKRWVEFEERAGDARAVERVQKRAAEWVRERKSK
jgi:rRNA biogenesis protein RRP5